MTKFEEITKDILESPVFLETKNMVHHGKKNSVYDHSVAAAKMAYRLAGLCRMGEEETASLVRTTLLHDFFGYDWHEDWYKSYVKSYRGFGRLKHKHAFIHGDIAAARAKFYFNLSERQCKAIQSHMFPACFAVPKTKEAWLVTLSDKLVASREVSSSAALWIGVIVVRALKGAWFL